MDGRRSPKKQPYLVRHRDQTAVLCATISQYPNAERGADEHDGFVIITADSAGGIVDTHDWRPVTLSPDLAHDWLNRAASNGRAEQIDLIQSEPAEVFEWLKIDRAVDNVQNQWQELITPMDSSLT